MDLPAVQLLCLTQEDRSFEDHLTREFLDLAPSSFDNAIQFLTPPPLAPFSPSALLLVAPISCSDPRWAFWSPAPPWCVDPLASPRPIDQSAPRSLFSTWDVIYLSPLALWLYRGRS